MKKNKSIKLTNLVMSLGLATTVLGTIATSVGVSGINKDNIKAIAHDLNTMLKIESGNSSSLQTNTQLGKLGITTICKDGNGGFYVGGKNGLFEHFDSNGELLQSKDSKDKITFDITSITLNKNNYVLISGSNAAHVVMDSEGNILKNLNLNNAFKIQGTVSKSFSSKNGQTYIVGTHGLVSIFDINGVELKTLNLGQDVNVNAMIETDDSIVLGTEQGGLFFINKITNKVSSTQANSPVVSIQTNEGGVFVQTQTKSLEVSNNNEILNSQDLNIFKNAKVTNIVSTEKGYIATGAKGHVALLDKSFKVISQSIALQGKDISSIVKDDESGFYIAGDKGLVSHINSEGVENSEEIKTLLDGNDIYGMQRNDEGHIFVFGNSFKVAELDNQGKIIKHFNLLGISSINTATTKADGEIIFGGEVKSTKVWDTRIESETTSESPLAATATKTASNVVTPTTLQNNGNNQLVGSVNYDFKTTKDEKIQSYSKYPSLSKSQSNITNGLGASFLEDSKGNLWSAGYKTPLQFSSDGGASWTVDTNSKVTSTGHFQSIVEDSKGFIWVMGDNCLLEKFEYNKDNVTGKWTEQDTSNGSNIVATIDGYGRVFQDSRGVLWSMNSSTYPQRYDYSTQTWTPLTATSKLTIGAFPKFYEDSRHTLWYGGNGIPLQKSEDGGDTWVNAGVLANSFGAFIFEDSNGTIWAGSTSGFVKSLDGGQTFIPAGNGSIFTNAEWGKMLEDSHGILWVVANGGKLQYSEDGGENWNIDSTSNITSGRAGSLFEDYEGVLWSGGVGTPIQKYDYTKKRWIAQTLAETGSTTTNGQESLFYEDSNHNLWNTGAGCPLQVKHFGEDKWTTMLLKSRYPDDVDAKSSDGGSIFEDSQGRMWMMNPDTQLKMSMDHGYTWANARGSDMSGVGNIFEDPKTKTIYVLNTTYRAAKMIKAAQNGVPAVYTQASKPGMYKMEKGKSYFEFAPELNLTNFTEFNIQQDSHGVIWTIASGDPVRYFKPGGSGWITPTTLPVEGGVGSKFFIDTRKRVWILGNCPGNHLWYTDDSGTTFKTDPNYVFPSRDEWPTMFEKADGSELMVSNCENPGTASTSSDGGKTWTSVTGLPAVAGMAFLIDSYGNKWMRYYNGGYSQPYTFVNGKWAIGTTLISQQGTAVFSEDSMGTLWYSSDAGVQFSIDKGQTWVKQDIFKTHGGYSTLQEDSENRLWLFTKGEPPQFIYLKNPKEKILKTVKSEIKGSIQVNAFAKENKMSLGFVGLEKLRQLGVKIQYSAPGISSREIVGSSIGVDVYGKYVISFALTKKSSNLGITQGDLPHSLTITINDGDGQEKQKITTTQPTISGGTGTFEWDPFINSMHATLQYSINKGVSWVNLPEEGGSFDKQDAGASMKFKWVLDPNHTWTHQPINPPTETIVEIGVGNLETITKDGIEDQIKKWMNTFDFSGWTQFGFINSCPDSKQKITIVSDTKVTAECEFSLVPTSDNKFHYEITGLKLSNIKGPMLEATLPKVFANIKAFSKEFDIKTGDFESVNDLIQPTLFSKFLIDSTKLPSTLINKQAPAGGGTYHYVDPNGLFTIDFTANDEDGKIHYSALEKGNTIHPTEGDLSGFYSYKLMSQRPTDTAIETKVNTQLSASKFSDSTKEIFNAINASKTKKISFSINGYTFEMVVSLKATMQDKLEYEIKSYTVKEATKDIPSALQSSELKAFVGKKGEVHLPMNNKFTTFDELVDGLIKSDSTKMPSKAVAAIPNIVKSTVAGSKSFDYTVNKKFKITFTPDDATHEVKWTVVSVDAPTIKGSGTIKGFQPITNVTNDEFKAMVISSGLYDLTKLPSDAAQPQTGQKHQINGVNFELTVVPSDIVGEMTIEAEYADQIGNKKHVGPIKIFGFKDLSSLITENDIKKAVVALLPKGTSSSLTKGEDIFGTSSTGLPSEVYINKNGYDIKILLEYSFEDKTINAEAILPDGNIVQNKIKVSKIISAGHPSEIEPDIWDASKVVTPSDTLGEIIKAKLLADKMDHNRLPSDVTTVISKINMERGFDFSAGTIANAFAGYASMEINGQYSIVYNNTTHSLQVIDTSAKSTMGSAVAIGGNGVLMNAFAYNADHMVIFSGGVTGKRVHVELVDMKTGAIANQFDVADGTGTNAGISAIQEVSSGKFIYQDTAGNIHFLLIDVNNNKLIADEKANLNIKNITDINNFKLMDLSTFNVLSNGDFIIKANDKMYEVKFDGITISIVNTMSVNKASKFIKVGENKFLINEGTNIYISTFTPGVGFDTSKPTVSPVNLDISNSVRVNAEYIVVRSAAKIYKININTAEITDITPLIGTSLKPSTGSTFISLGNKEVLYTTATGTGVLKVLTDGFSDAMVSAPKVDNARGVLEFSTQFLGKTVTYVDKGYWQEINAHSKDIPTYIKVTGDASNLAIDESGVPSNISDHAHIEYSLDGTIWYTQAKLITFLLTKPKTVLSGLQVKYVTDAKFVIKDNVPTDVFPQNSTLDNSKQQALLDALANAQVEGSVLQATLPNVASGLFENALHKEGMKLMIRIGGNAGIWTEFDVSSAKVDLPQIFDEKGINQGSSATLTRYSFNVLDDRSKLSIDFKLEPIDGAKRLSSQKITHLSDYSKVKIMLQADESKLHQDKVEVTGGSGKLLFDETGAIDKSTGPSAVKVGIEYSLTGGTGVTEKTLREIFDLDSTYTPAKIQALIKLFDQYNWFTKDQFANEIEPKITGLNIKADDILARFVSEDKTVILDQHISKPFSTTGKIFIFHDVKNLEAEISDFKNHLIGSKDNLQVKIPTELMPRELASYGTTLDIRDGGETIKDNDFGIALQYSTVQNPSESDWKTIKPDDLRGQTFIFPKINGGTTELSMRLKPIKVTNGFVNDWDALDDSTDKTLIKDTTAYKVESTKGIKIDLSGIKKVVAITLPHSSGKDDLHFDEASSAISAKEPTIPTYKIDGDKNGELTLAIDKNEIPKFADVYVQQLRPIKNEYGQTLDSKGAPILGYEMLTVDSKGVEAWVKVATVTNGKLEWKYIDYNNLSDSWIESSKVKLSVGDHLRFRLHTSDPKNEFLWTDSTFNNFSELIYSNNNDPKNDQDDFGIPVKKIMFTPKVDATKVELKFGSPTGKEGPKNWDASVINSDNPTNTDNWIWHYSIFAKDGTTLVGEYDRVIPNNILENGMVIKMKIVSTEENTYELDPAFNNVFKDVIISWPEVFGPSWITLNTTDFKIDGSSGRAKLVEKLDKTKDPIKDVKLLYKVMDGTTEISKTSTLPTELKNGEEVVVTVSPLNENTRINPDTILDIKVENLEENQLNVSNKPDTKADVDKTVETVPVDKTFETDKPVVTENNKDVKETLPDGTKVMNNGTKVKTDGTRILPNGMEITPDGTKKLIPIKKSWTVAKALYIFGGILGTVATGGLMFFLIRRKTRKEE